MKLTTILICGGSCSGKTVFANLFKHAMVLEMDHFYIGKKAMKPQSDGSYNFDEPNAVNLIECAEAIKNLASRNKVEIPIYDMKETARTGTQVIEPKPDDTFLIVPGIFSFHEPIRKLADLKIYLDTPREIRVARRMIRDVQKGRNDIDTLAWSITVEKNHQKYIEPMKQFADLVIPFSYNPVEFLQ